MKNLASMVDRNDILKGIQTIQLKRPNLNSATKYHLIHEGESFPPKEVIRYAARAKGIKNFHDYSLVGGNPTNKYLKQNGFEIQQFADWKQEKKLTHTLPEKISRLVWNNNGWKKPSGREGKSKSDSYEKKHGHGHEEWLLDLAKVVDGYHYGFLEPINKYRDSYVGKHFNVLLYTANGKTSQRFLLGKLIDIEVITPDESLQVLKTYRKRGWLDEMRNQLVQVELDPRKLDKWIKNGTILNIKFKPQNYIPFPEPVLLQDHKKYIKSDRYMLLNKDFDLNELFNDDNTFSLTKTKKERALKKSAERTYAPNITQHPLIHNQISLGLEKALQKQYEIVSVENDTGYGTKIDLVALDKTGYFFYEIKTYDHILMCIRTAVGQLLEYSCYEKREVAKKLYIVSQHHADKPHRDYISHLRKLYNLPLHYICYDCESATITQEF